MPRWATRVAPSVLGIEGQLANGDEVIARFATAGIRAGLVCEFNSASAADDLCDPLAVLPAADPNGILATAFAPVVAGQTLTDVAGAPGGVFDGVIGPGRITPPRCVTITFDANANWGLAALGGTWCWLYGLDASGDPQMEWFFMPAGGNIVVSSVNAYSKLTTCYIGACDGAGGGNGLIGVNNDVAAYGRLDYGIALYDDSIEPSAVAAVTYDVNESVPIVIEGTVNVVVETTAALAVTQGDPVAVRCVTVGADVRGQLTRYTSPSMGNFALLPNAEWVTSGAAGTIQQVRIWR
jgi:hypothetical protein